MESILHPAITLRRISLGTMSIGKSNLSGKLGNCKVVDIQRNGQRGWC